MAGRMYSWHKHCDDGLIDRFVRFAQDLNS